MKLRVKKKLDLAWCNNLDCDAYVTAHRCGATFEIKYEPEKHYNIYFPEGTILDTDELKSLFLGPESTDYIIDKWLENDLVELAPARKRYE